MIDGRSPAQHAAKRALKLNDGKNNRSTAWKKKDFWKKKAATLFYTHFSFRQSMELERSCLFYCYIKLNTVLETKYRALTTTKKILFFPAFLSGAECTGGELSGEKKRAINISFFNFPDSCVVKVPFANNPLTSFIRSPPGMSKKVCWLGSRHQPRRQRYVHSQRVRQRQPNSEEELMDHL